MSTPGSSKSLAKGITAGAAGVPNGTEEPVEDSGSYADLFPAGEH